MKLSSLMPYDFRFTSILIRRDLKDLKSKAKKTLKAKVRLLSKAQQRFPPKGPLRREDIYPGEQALFTSPMNPVFNMNIENNEVVDESDSFGNCLVSSGPVEDDIVEQNGVNEHERDTDNSSDSANEDTSGHSPPVSVTGPSRLPVHAGANSMPSDSGLYKCLQIRLKELYESRPCNMAHEDRWSLRGSWIILVMAIQTAPSNPIHELFQDEKPVMSDEELIHGLYQINAQQCNNSTPTMAEILHTTPLSSMELWAAVWFTVFGPNNIIRTAELLLSVVWPERNAREVLHQLGYPKKSLPVNEEDELRRLVQEAMFPAKAHAIH